MEGLRFLDFRDGRDEADDASDTNVGAGDTLGATACATAGATLGGVASSGTESGLVSAGCWGVLVSVSFSVFSLPTSMGLTCFLLSNFLLMKISMRINPRSAAAAMTPPMI